MITILVGDDRHAIEREIAAFKADTNPTWRYFNCHQFSCNELESAIACARTTVFGDGKKVVVIEECNFRQFGEEGFKILECLCQLPETTHLIFTAHSLDKRLKVSKHLLKYGKLMEFTLIPPWRKDLIATSIATQAKAVNLRLSKDAVNYLAEAIGNDTARCCMELKKLAVYANGNPITKAQVQALVPCTTQTSLQLVASLRQGKVTQVATLLHELLARAEYPLVIVATLITQFRTWLWVKASLDKGMNKDHEIAQLCQVGNPKRMYYLRQEVKDASLRSLAQALTLLLDLEVALKSGAGIERMLPVLLGVVHLFKPRSTKAV
ncbi:MAG: DNA polymerase III subunit delta [Symploca sp. SIO2E9]|nr:DNA polymerase III subunit delta [Symploca sp. SIO2E9]